MQTQKEPPPKKRNLTKFIDVYFKMPKNIRILYVFVSRNYLKRIPEEFLLLCHLNEREPELQENVMPRTLSIVFGILKSFGNTYTLSVGVFGTHTTKMRIKRAKQNTNKNKTKATTTL